MAISGGGLPPGFPNRGPISDQKMSFSTPVFRIGVYEILLLLLRLEHHTKDFLNFSLNLCYCSLFIYRELKLPRSYTPIVPWKTIPDSRAKFKPVFRPKRRKNGIPFRAAHTGFRGVRTQISLPTSTLLLQ